MVIMREFDMTRYLNTPEQVAAFLDEALHDEDPNMFIVALGEITKAQGMTALAQQAGVGRESLYKSLSEQGNPSFATVRKILDALGIDLNTNSKKEPIYA